MIRLRKTKISPLLQVKRLRFLIICLWRLPKHEHVCNYLKIIFLKASNFFKQIIYWCNLGLKRDGTVLFRGMVMMQMSKTSESGGKSILVWKMLKIIYNFWHTKIINKQYTPYIYIYILFWVLIRNKIFETRP